MPTGIPPTARRPWITHRIAIGTYSNEPSYIHLERPSSTMEAAFCWPPPSLNVLPERRSTATRSACCSDRSGSRVLNGTATQMASRLRHRAYGCYPATSQNSLCCTYTKELGTVIALSHRLG